MGIALTVNGTEQAQGAFKRKAAFAPRALKNCAKRIGTMQGKAIKAAIKRSRSGLLAKSIGSKVSEKRPGKLTILAGARRGFRTVVLKDTGRGKVHGLRQDKKGNLKKVVLNAFAGQRLSAKDKFRERAILSPTRYAHLADKGHAKGQGKGAAQGQHFMAAAKSASDGPAKEMHAEALREVAKA